MDAGLPLVPRREDAPSLDSLESGPKATRSLRVRGSALAPGPCSAKDSRRPPAGWGRLRHRAPPVRLGRAAAGAPGDLPDQRGQAVQHDLPALPRRRGSRSHGREHGSPDRRPVPGRPGPDDCAHRRHHGGRAGAEPPLPLPGRAVRDPGQARHRPVQPDHSLPAPLRGPARMARRAGCRGCVLTAALPPPEHRRPARGRHVREVHRGPAPAERGGIRPRGCPPPPHPDQQPGRRLPAAASGQHRAANGRPGSSNTTGSRSTA